LVNKPAAEQKNDAVESYKPSPLPTAMFQQRAPAPNTIQRARVPPPAKKANPWDDDKEEEVEKSLPKKLQPPAFT
jgi:hypothetical protein